MTSPSHTGSNRLGCPSEQPIGLEHVRIENVDLPDECLLMPRDPSDGDPFHQWIVALEGSFVDLDDVR